MGESYPFFARNHGLLIVLTFRWHVKWDILGPDEPNTILADVKRLVIGDLVQDDGGDDDDEDFDDLPQQDTGKNVVS